MDADFARFFGKRGRKLCAPKTMVRQKGKELLRIHRACTAAPDEFSRETQEFLLRHVPGLVDAEVERRPKRMTVTKFVERFALSGRLAQIRTTFVATTALRYEATADMRAFLAACAASKISARRQGRFVDFVCRHLLQEAGWLARWSDQHLGQRDAADKVLVACLHDVTVPGRSTEEVLDALYTLSQLRSKSLRRAKCPSALKRTLPLKALRQLLAPYCQDRQVHVDVGLSGFGLQGRCDVLAFPGLLELKCHGQAAEPLPEDIAQVLLYAALHGEVSAVVCVNLYHGCTYEAQLLAGFHEAMRSWLA